MIMASFVETRRYDKNIVRTQNYSSEGSKLPIVAGGRVPPEFTHRGNMNPVFDLLRRIHARTG